MKRTGIFCVILAALFWGGCGKSQKGVTLRFSVWGGQTEKEVWNRTISAFEKKNPGIRVVLDVISSGYQDKLQSMIASGTAPDVFYTDHSSLFYNLVSRDLLLDLTSRISNSREFSLEAYFPEAVRMFSVRGRLYAFPKDLHTFVVYVNKDAFDSAGIPFPSSDWTWDEFLETARRLTAHGIKNGAAEKKGFLWDPRFWVMLVHQNNGRLFSANYDRSLFSDARVIEALRFLNNALNKEKVCINPGSIKYEEMNQMFVLGKIGMYVSGVWVGAGFRQSSFRWDILPLPRGRKKSTGLVGSGCVVHSGTAHPEEACRFGMFTIQEEAEKIYASLGVSIPTLKSVAFSRAFLDPNQPPSGARIFLDEIAFGRTLDYDDFSRGKEIYDTVIQPELDKIWFDGQNPEAVCQEIDRKIAGYFKRNRKAE